MQCHACPSKFWKRTIIIFFFEKWKNDDFDLLGAVLFLSSMKTQKHKNVFLFAAEITRCCGCRRFWYRRLGLIIVVNALDILWFMKRSRQVIPCNRGTGSDGIDTAPLYSSVVDASRQTPITATVRNVSHLASVVRPSSLRAITRDAVSLSYYQLTSVLVCNFDADGDLCNKS